MPNLPLEEARQLVIDALERCNTSTQNAHSVANALIDAELAGQAGHGLRRVPSYAGQAASGKVDGHATPIVDQKAPAALYVDAANGFAYPASDQALERLPGLAASNGVAMAGITRSHHCGVAGVTVEKLAAEGLIAMMFANTPSAIAPWGGDKGVFGTNPIAFATPRGNGEPVVVDVSLSKVARGKIMAAQQKGEAIPEGWAFGPDGEPATDPDVALQGTMAPLGDAKGTALALMVEVLAAGLTGAQFAADASSFFTAEGPAPGVGQLIIAIDAKVFGGPGILDHIGDLAALIEAQEGARLPGARRLSIRQQLMRDGIAIDDDLLAQIQAIGR